MNWKNTLIAVFSPTKAGKDAGVNGTAFPVGKDLVMTARHVVMPADADETRPIQLKWWYSGDGPQDYLNRDNLILWSCEKLDVALLRVKRPADVSGTCQLEARKPPSNGRWESEGFPTAARIKGELRPTSLAGVVMTKADNEDYFQITIDSGLNTQNLNGWGGGSGMPVLVDGVVLGVAVKVEENFQGTIQVAPIWKFWESIRKYVVPEGSIKNFEAEVKRRIESFIRNEECISVLRENRKDENDFLDIISDGDGGISVSTAVVKIMRMEPRTLFLSLYFACKALDERSIISLRVGGSHHCVYRHGRMLLGRIIDHVAPFILAVSTGRAPNAAGLTIREVPIATPTMAEIVRAAEDGRDVSLWPRQKAAEYPMGRTQVPLTIEFGGNGDLMVKMVKAAFVEQYGFNIHFNDIKNSLRRSTTNLVAVLVGRELVDVECINDAIEGIIERREALPFLALVTPVEELQKAALLAQLKTIHEEIPSLPIMLLTSDGGVLRRETWELDHFIRLIPMADGTRRDV